MVQIPTSTFKTLREITKNPLRCMPIDCRYQLMTEIFQNVFDHALEKEAFVILYSFIFRSIKANPPDHWNILFQLTIDFHSILYIVANVSSQMKCYFILFLWYTFCQFGIAFFIHQNQFVHQALFGEKDVQEIVAWWTQTAPKINRTQFVEL